MKKKLLMLSVLAGTAMTFAQQKITIIPSVGYAWRVAKTADNMDTSQKEYVKGLKSGFNFDIGAYYRVNASTGLGIKYNLYTASHTGDFRVTNPQQNESLILNDFKTDDRISFVGPGFIYSNFEEDVKHKLYYDMAVGVISYVSKNQFVETKGSNLGLATTIGYMYGISPAVMIGPQVSYTGGVLKKYKINGTEYKLNKGEYEGLHRVAASLGATFRF